jgi:hypothetical protein
MLAVTEMKIEIDSENEEDLNVFEGKIYKPIMIKDIQKLLRKITE